MSSTKKSPQIAVVAAILSGDPRAAAAMAQAAGFTGLQFDAAAPNLDLTDFSASARRQFRQMLTQNNQQLVGLRSDAGIKGIMPGADIDRVLWRWNRVLETAAGLTAPLVCLELGHLPAPPITPPQKPVTSHDALGLILLPPPPAENQIPPTPLSRPGDLAAIPHVDAALGELGRLADRYGVMIALRSELSSFAALQRALAAVACPWFGVDLDPVALMLDEWDGDEFMSRLGNLLRHLRGRDAMAGTAHRTRPATIGNGSTNWRQLLALLNDADYNGWITLDPTDLPNRPAAATTGLNHLRSLEEKTRNSQ